VFGKSLDISGGWKIITVGEKWLNVTFQNNGRPTGEPPGKPVDR